MKRHGLHVLILGICALVGGCASYPQAGESLRIVRGTVGIDGDGKPVQHIGAGWDVEEVEKGVYRITFDEPFPAGPPQNRPSVVVTAFNVGIIATTPQVDQDWFEIRLVRRDGKLVNVPANFIAIGRR